MSPENAGMLMRYAAWANSLLYAAIAELPEMEMTKRRPGFFGSIIRTLNHVYAMDLVWQAHLEGRPHGFTTRNPDPLPAFVDLRAAQATVDDWYVLYAAGLSNHAGAQIIKFDFIGGGEGAMSRVEILLHVVNHTTYHRGHIVDMMNQIPAQPPTTDLPVFLRDAR
jgi:uncharacterized damage-inducible protein DinB